jgi:hypothetical protein
MCDVPNNKCCFILPSDALKEEAGTSCCADCIVGCAFFCGVVSVNNMTISSAFFAARSLSVNPSSINSRIQH